MNTTAKETETTANPDKIIAHVRIMQEEFTLSSNKDEKYMQLMASYVQDKLNALLQSKPQLSRAKAAVLTALSITDELNEIQKKYDELYAAYKALEKQQGE